MVFDRVQFRLSNYIIDISAESLLSDSEVQRGRFPTVLRRER